MKTYKKLRLIFITAGFGLATTLSAFSPPTDSQINQALANPGMVLSLIQDASGEEAADVLLRLLTRISQTNASESQKNFLAAYYSARIAFLLGAEAEPLATLVVPKAPQEMIPAILAGLSIGSRGSSSVMAALREFAGENEAHLQAINAPNIPLTDPVYMQLLSALGASQSLPPAVTDSLPPPIPVGTGTSTPPPPAPRPPVPEPYAGQS